eukprot:11228034-Lingulodinium_polyedra.AAC.1
MSPRPQSRRPGRTAGADLSALAARLGLWVFSSQIGHARPRASGRRLLPKLCSRGLGPLDFCSEPKAAGSLLKPFWPQGWGP